MNVRILLGIVRPLTEWVSEVATYLTTLPQASCLWSNLVPPFHIRNAIMVLLRNGHPPRSSHYWHSIRVPSTSLEVNSTNGKTNMWPCTWIGYGQGLLFGQPHDKDALCKVHYCNILVGRSSIQRIGDVYYWMPIHCNITMLCSKTNHVNHTYKAMIQ